MKNKTTQASDLALDRHPLTAESSPDFAITHHGTVSLLHPQTGLAHAWFSEHCSSGAEHTYFGAALVVEPRYVNDLVANAVEDGLNAIQE